jgi:hypothetical protein
MNSRDSAYDDAIAASLLDAGVSTRELQDEKRRREQDHERGHDDEAVLDDDHDRKVGGVKRRRAEEEDLDRDEDGGAGKKMKRRKEDDGESAALLVLALPPKLRPWGCCYSSRPECTQSQTSESVHIPTKGCWYSRCFTHAGEGDGGISREESRHGRRRRRIISSQERGAQGSPRHHSCHVFQS